MGTSSTGSRRTGHETLNSSGSHNSANGFRSNKARAEIEQDPGFDLELNTFFVFRLK